MHPMTAPFHLSLAGLRLGAYMLETNMRIAQVVGEAMVKANPVLRRRMELAALDETPCAAKTLARPAATRLATQARRAKRKPSPPPMMPETSGTDVRLI